MPYIPCKQRVMADPLTYYLTIDTSGKLNFAITKLCEEYRYMMGDSYCTWNTIIGALESAKLEYYRRVVAPYEAMKMKENGDVYRTQYVLERMKMPAVQAGDRVHARSRLGVMRVWLFIRRWWT